MPTIAVSLKFAFHFCFFVFTYAWNIHTPAVICLWYLYVVLHSEISWWLDNIVWMDDFWFVCLIYSVLVAFNSNKHFQFRLIEFVEFLKYSMEYSKHRYVIKNDDSSKNVSFSLWHTVLLISFFFSTFRSKICLTVVFITAIHYAL